MRRLIFITCLSIITISFGQGLNDEVIKIANSFEGGGYKWQGSTGTPTAIHFQNTKILSKGSGGTHCSGYTFSVAFDALDQAGKLDHLSVDQVKWLQRNWYGTNDASAETQCLYSLAFLNLGEKVNLSDAKAGDFVQFWRNNKSGHSVIFLNWVKNEGKIIGIKYRSTQKSTDGIGDRIETIGSDDKDINLNRLYIVRLKG